MIVITLDQGVVLSETDEDVLAVDCSRYLDASETIASGTATAVTDLTLGSVTPNAAAMTIRGSSVAIGNAVTLTVKGQKITTGTYTVPLLLVTSAGRKKAFGCRFTVQ